MKRSNRSRWGATLDTVLGALLAIVVTILLGFVGAWHHDFNGKQGVQFNRIVLLYAAPMVCPPALRAYGAMY